MATASAQRRCRDLSRGLGTRKSRGLPGPRLHALHVAGFGCGSSHRSREAALHRIGRGSRRTLGRCRADIVGGQASAGPHR